MALARRTIVLYGLLALAAAALIVFGLNSVYGLFGSSTSSAAAQRTATVTRGLVQSSVSASGNVGVARSASAGFATSGTLTAVGVAVGAHVKPGQVLAKIDPTSARVALQTAQANLAQAESALSTAQSGPTAAQVAANAVSLQQAQQTVITDGQQLASDGTTLATAKAQLLSDTKLSCPALTSASTVGSSASGAASTNAASTNAASTNAASTNAASPGAASPGAASPGAASPGAASPGAASPGAASPGAASTNAASTNAGSSASGSTASAANGAASSGSASSGSAASGSASSGGSTSAGSSSGGLSGVVLDGVAVLVRVAVAPVVSTGAASGVGSSGALLGGSVTPSGLDTTYHFEYGVSASSLSSVTETSDAGFGSGPVPVSVPVSGLRPSQNYLFRLVATNSSGTTDGDLALFTTTVAPPIPPVPVTTPVVTTGPVSAVGSAGVTLNGSVNPQGFDTSYHFEYGTSVTSLGSVTGTVDAGSGSGAVPVSAVVGGLTPDQTYYVALVASNSSGTTTGAFQLFTTSAVAFATTGSASLITATSATLGGAVTPGGLDTTYHFEYGTSVTSLSSATGSVDAGSAATGSVPASVPVAGLSPGRTYYFELVATNSSGTAYGTAALFSTGTLSLATTGSASLITSTAATLGGTVTPGGLATSYRFDYGTSPTSLNVHTQAFNAGRSAAGSVPVSVALAGLQANRAYYFRLVATNSSGTTDGAPALFTTAGPSVTATTGQASLVGSTTATFSGTVDPGDLDTSYRFEYGTSTSSFASATATRSAGSGTGSVSVSATVTGLHPGRTYVFRLVAANSSGTSDGVSETFTTTTGGVPVVVTGAASSLTTTVTLNGTINPNGSDTKYWFEYGTTGRYGSRTPVLDSGSGTSATAVSTTVKGLRPNTQYLFRLVARSLFGPSAGIGEVAKTAETSCVSDAQTVTADEQTLQHQQATLKAAKESLVETQATIASSETPSATTIAQDEATVAQDEATVTADQKALAETTLTAPTGGVVTAVNDSVGELVSASGSSITTAGASAASAASSAAGGASSGSGSSSGLVTIDSLGQLEIVAGFAEADATKIAVGQPATITFPALPNTELAGKVVAVAATSTVVSNVVTYNETIALINPPAEVKEGMTAAVSVVDQSASNALELPSSAITTTGTISTVELLQNGKTTVTPVTTGLVGNSSTQIVSGLKLGNVVVEPTVAITAASSSTAGAGLGGGLGGGFGGGGGGGGGGAAFLRGG
jgi:multidrug efflux pump subunit AcrA (membrane-fusion protein)